ncbi:MAG: hypothetical protein ACP5QK_13205, partial [Myxococcota bacterium]
MKKVVFLAVFVVAIFFALSLYAQNQDNKGVGTQTQEVKEEAKEVKEQVKEEVKEIKEEAKKKGKDAK